MIFFFFFFWGGGAIFYELCLSISISQIAIEYQKEDICQVLKKIENQIHISCWLKQVRIRAQAVLSVYIELFAGSEGLPYRARISDTEGKEDPHFSWQGLIVAWHGSQCVHFDDLLFNCNIFLIDGSPL